MNKAQLSLIGHAVGGTFSHEEGENFIFGSNTFPSHRIVVTRADAEKFFADYAEDLVANLPQG